MEDQSPKTRLHECMSLELKLLDAFREAELKLQDGVSRKDWDGLERCMQEMITISNELAEVEAQRSVAFRELQKSAGETESAGFYEVIVHLPAEEREALAELYRAMRFSAVGIRSVTHCIDEHLRTINGALQQVLNELFPYRKGNLYSKTGERREARGNPMVVNHNL